VLLLSVLPTEFNSNYIYFTYFKLEIETPVGQLRRMTYINHMKHVINVSHSSLVISEKGAKNDAASYGFFFVHVTPFQMFLCASNKLNELILNLVEQTHSIFHRWLLNYCIRYPETGY
jgi:hypothetical protein